MKRKQGKSLRKLVTRLFIAVFAVYAVVSLVDMQVTLAQRKQELLELEEKYDRIEVDNKELRRKIEDGSDQDIERIARENGYVAPDERVFIDISGR